MKKREIVFRILLVLYLAALGYVCFSSSESLPVFPPEIFGLPFDKVVHFTMFLPFPFLLYFCFPKIILSKKHSILVALQIFVCGAALAWGTEFIQGYLPERQKDIMDLVADCSAIFLGSLAVFFINRK